MATSDHFFVRQAFGISWSPALCFGVAAAGTFLVSAVSFAILFKHKKGAARRLSPEEAARVAYSEPARADAVELEWATRSKAVGVEVQLDMNIDSLRNAARRGDWLTFWLSPLVFSSFFTAGLFFSLAVMLAFSAPLSLLLIVAAFLALPVLIIWFMPWAALYTKIDLGKSDE
ncbi:MAG TPA: hypothetical protein VFK05_12400 [Polyangiaceae bacterium]|nr:hypothetical protein [Polyangiaceae bacterium]